MELTGQFGNMIHDFDYDKSTVNSSIFSLLKEYKFSTPDLENGSCLSLIANIWFDEPTNVNTAIMVSLLGNTETQFTIPVNTSFDADKFSTVLEVEYYVQVFRKYLYRSRCFGKAYWFEWHYVLLLQKHKCFTIVFK